MSLINSLKGYKTYALGILGIVFALSGFALGKLDSVTAFAIFFNSLAIMGIRNGVTTEAEKLVAMLPDKTIASTN